MIELWQTEWCPASRRIRERLTELDVSYIARQVPVDKAERTVLMAAVGSDSIPALVLEDGSAVIDEVAIGARLDAHVPEPEGAQAHRTKAAKARRRELELAASELTR
jgi:glutathione S-transferase